MLTVLGVVVAYHFLLYIFWLGPLIKDHNKLVIDVHELSDIRDRLQEAEEKIEKLTKFTNFDSVRDGQIDLGDGNYIYLDENGNPRGEA